jgi:trehalose 2-sulfotransferase
VAASAPEHPVLRAPAVNVYDLSEAQADYPPWSGTPRKSLVICTQQRSGSTLLGEAITFAGGLGRPLEYLHPGFRPALQERWQADDLTAYIAQLHRFRTDPAGVFALKLFWRDLLDLANERAPGAFEPLRMGSPAEIAPEVYRALFALLAGDVPDATWIFLTRRDALRQALSNYVAWQTDSWRQFSERRPKAVEYDADLIRRLLSRVLRSNAHWRHFFDANGIAPIEIVYEDIERDYDGTLRKLLKDLGRDMTLPPPRLRKQADDRVEALRARFLAEFGG